MENELDKINEKKHLLYLDDEEFRILGILHHIAEDLIVLVKVDQDALNRLDGILHPMKED